MPLLLSFSFVSRQRAPRRYADRDPYLVVASAIVPLLVLAVFGVASLF